MIGEEYMENLELIMTIHVKTEEAITLQSNIGDSVVMIPFTGHATGSLFQGEIQKGGVDTQIISQDRKKHSLSARYMIVGKDYVGQDCTIYIENNGNIYEPNNKYLFRTYPQIITSSPTLKYIESEILVAEGTADVNGVIINIYVVN